MPIKKLEKYKMNIFKFGLLFNNSYRVIFVIKKFFWQNIIPLQNI
jgi:hypothetical protein